MVSWSSYELCRKPLKDQR
uniref:BLTX359 n=1 Tax=Nephila pilipes TaxID=299642 RepID=A0A076KZZ9_NEPPI|nr:BLTX359 [Nephila pilipes]AII97787.1 BLTX412 [Nephila pilipes]